MANIAVTERCNRSCSYCFASLSTERKSHEDTSMSLSIFRDTMKLMKRSGIKEIRLLGGEPTLHPQFNNLLDEALANQFNIMVFTGGLVPNSVLDKLANIDTNRLFVLLNVVLPHENQPALRKKQLYLMERLGRRIALGINIDRPSINLDYLLPLIVDYGLARTVRLGIAHPSLHASNTFLHPRHYSQVGQRVTDFAVQAHLHQIELEFDCGWVPCMFPPESFEALNKSPGDIGQRCNPILDILPNGQVISCFPLRDHQQEHINDYSNCRELRSAFSNTQRKERVAMLYTTCRTCKWRIQGDCTGGCLAASMRRQCTKNFSLVLPQASND